MTDYRRYRKCPVCFAEIGMPCMAQSGSGPTVTAPRPHSRRQLRTGYARQSSNGDS